MSKFGPFQNPYFDPTGRGDGYEAEIPAALRNVVLSAATTASNLQGLVIDPTDASLALPKVLTPEPATPSQRSDNQVALQAAVNLATSVAKPVYIPAGTYTLYASPVAASMRAVNASNACDG